MWNGYKSDNFKNFINIGSKVTESYEGVIYREISLVSSFRNVMDQLFALTQKYKMKIMMLCNCYWNYYWLVYKEIT